MKGKLSKHEIKSNPWGILLIFAGVMMHIVGNIGAELFTMRVSMVLTLWALSFYVFGTRISMQILFPMIYLLLMIPIPAIVWNEIAFPLKLFASKLTTDVVQFIGIPIYREGNILHLTTTTLEVVNACSGLRSLTSLIALSGALAYFVPVSRLSKWILFFMAVPIAIFVNLVRLTITAIMAQYIGEKAAKGFLHDSSGLLIFGLALVLLFLTFILLRKIELFSKLRRNPVHD
jgi:exosortase